MATWFTKNIYKDMQYTAEKKKADWQALQEIVQPELMQYIESKNAEQEAHVRSITSGRKDVIIDNFFEQATVQHKSRN